ncbi:heme oxygenase-like [Engraulis encrasicolus]|uniref:heme oxygenase-like n=1 Tax=Engraulis encrasicolus TaxID=184585 RepID=UPI002FD560AB
MSGEDSNNTVGAEMHTDDSDLSESIKAVTKESHVRAENTELMRSYVRGQVSSAQYKLLLCSLYEIYKALEEALDKNACHPAVMPIHFPQELARLGTLQRDLEHFYGPRWREQVIAPAATLRYAARLREIGEKHPEYLVAHAYTRYLGDLSGGQVLGRITQKSLGLKDGEGVSFFSFPAVTSPSLFKQLYRSRMNSIELSPAQREGVLQEAVTAFELNIQVFDDIQGMLSISQPETDLRQRHTKHSHSQLLQDNSMKATPLQMSSSWVSAANPLLRMLLGVCVALAVGMGIYAF